MVVQVILNNSAYVYDKIYSYSVPPVLEKDVHIGSRVLVPFGRGNQNKEGLILGMKDSGEEGFLLKSIQSVMDAEPLLDEKMLNLGAFIKKRYLCSYYEAYKVLLPPGSGFQLFEFISLNPQISGIQAKQRIKNSKNQLEVFEILLENGGTLDFSNLSKLYKGTNLRNVITALREKDLIKIEFRQKVKTTDKKVRVVRLNKDAGDAIDYANLISKKAPVQARMIDILCQNESVSVKDLLFLTQGSLCSVNSLEEKGILTFEQIIVDREFDTKVYEKTQNFTPTNEQKQVIDEITQSLNSKKPQNYLLKGVTGSGKTEVYLQLIDKVIKQNRQAIVLVPEISLTPQTVMQFKQRFGDKIAVFHSGLSVGERFDQWKKIKENKVSVAIGARSCVFVPFKNLGIIIVDEEHENTYKSEMSPRYDTREIAAFRARQSNAILLLASATPSMESRFACDRGTFKLLTMTTRYNDNKMPQVIVCDMRKELQNGNKSIFSNRLKTEIEQNLAKKQQTILFLNRRGFSTFLSCRNCGYVVTCPNCSISLTYHKKTGSLLCHYCGYRSEAITLCPNCKSQYIKYFGIGTQKVEEEVHRLFPQASTIRMDMDTTASKFSHQKILERFQKENIDILIGTQMVAKGLDLHNVTLVGVIAADTSLNADDFKCYERTFSQIVQVSGRAGRGNTQGRSVVQTYNPESYAISYAKNHDYDSFYRNEIKFRKNLNYPPFCDIIGVLFTGVEEDLVKSAAVAFYKNIQNTAKNMNRQFSVMAPHPSSLYKVNLKYRYWITIKCPKNLDYNLLLKPAFDLHYTNRKLESVSVSVSINPNNLY